MVQRLRGPNKQSVSFLFLCGFSIKNIHDSHDSRGRRRLLLPLSLVSRKEKIKKTKELITPIVGTKKLYVSKYFVEGHMDSTKNQPKVGKSGLTNSGSLL